MYNMSVPRHLSHFLCVHSLKTHPQYRLFFHDALRLIMVKKQVYLANIILTIFFKPTAFGCYVSAIGNFGAGHV